MAYRANSELGYLVKFKPEEARVKILAAFRAAEGNAATAAAALGIGRRSFDRYAKQLHIDLAEQRANPVKTNSDHG